MTTFETFKEFRKFTTHDVKRFRVAFFLMFITLAMEIANPFILKRCVEHITNGELESLKSTALVFLVVVACDYIARSGFSYAAGIAFLRTINRIRGTMFNKVLHMKMAYFDKQPVGVLMTRTISDCEALSETLRAGVITVVLDVLSMVVVFGVLISLDWKMTAVTLIVAPVIWIVIRWSGGRLRQKFIEVRKALAESNGFMAEGIVGVEILQLFRKQDASADQFMEVNKAYRKATITSNVYDAFLYAAIDGIAALVTAMILYVAFDIRFGSVEVATLIVFLTQIERIFKPIREFSGKFATIQQALAAFQRILALLQDPARIDQGPKTLEGDRLQVTFEKVDFRYLEDGPKVLSGISFTIEAGQSVALVGQTGSGKSTIGKLLTRAYDGYEGRITVGGIELNDLNYHSLRSKIAVVHQDVELFPGTLRENISMFDDSLSEEKIMAAIRMVKAEHMVAQLPDGLDFEVRENGQNLSAGQMQLIVFARALAHDAPIVLMDEATASVDSVTEAWIQEAIAQILKCRTVLIVAHRLSTIAESDRILVLKNGEVIEEGTHQTLQAIENGYYAGLINASKLKTGGAAELLV